MPPPPRFRRSPRAAARRRLAEGVVHAKLLSADLRVGGGYRRQICPIHVADLSKSSSFRLRRGCYRATAAVVRASSRCCRAVFVVNGRRSMGVGERETHRRLVQIRAILSRHWRSEITSSPSQIWTDRRNARARRRRIVGTCYTARARRMKTDLDRFASLENSTFGSSFFNLGLLDQI